MRPTTATRPTASCGSSRGACGLLSFPHRLSRQGKPGAFLLGSFDLAVTRFSGRRAPLYPGGGPNCPIPFVQEAYSHEVSSAGFWPGGGRATIGLLSLGLSGAGRFMRARRQSEAFFAEEARRVHPAVRGRARGRAGRPLMAFLQSTYAVAADLASLGPRGPRVRVGRAGEGEGGVEPTRVRSFPLPLWERVPERSEGG